MDILLKVYKTYVRPVLEFNTVVYNPHQVSDISKLEKVQNMFTRRLYSRCGINYVSAVERCFMLNLESLELRRNKFDLCFVYKMFKGIVDLKFSDYFKFSPRDMRGHKLSLFQSHVRSG